MGDKKEDKQGSSLRTTTDGELVGYDMLQARAWALEHAQKELPARHRWLRDIPSEYPLIWEVPTARFVEGEDCYEVVVTCYPDEAEFQQKAEWTYHIDGQGKPAPGTPVLKAELKWRPRLAPGTERIKDSTRRWLKTAQQWWKNANREAAPAAPAQVAPPPVAAREAAPPARSALQWFSEGNERFGARSFAEAVLAFSQAIELDPKYAAAYYNRGIAYDDLKQYQEAIADYSRALELDPELALAYYRRGLACEKLGQKEEAKRDFAKAKELSKR